MSLPAKATISAKPYSIDVPQRNLDELQQLLKLSKLPPATYEGQHRKFGVRNAWMKEAKAQWENGYDWYVLLTGMVESMRFGECGPTRIACVLLFTNDCFL